MRVLVVDVGGTNVKILATGQTTARKVPSGPRLTPKAMVSEVKALAAGWEWDAVAIGYPGLIRDGRIMLEPHNLGRGWVGFDFAAAFGCPVRVLNDAAMQALGSYERGVLLFVGLGTGLGAALVVDGVVVPMELAHLPFKRGGTYEDYIGLRAFKRLSRKKWQKQVEYTTARLIEAFHPNDAVLGGGNAKKLKGMPPGFRAGTNANAFIGGFRMWAADKAETTKAPVARRRARRPRAKAPAEPESLSAA
jgi:polyphosphate glucokinase